MKTLIFPLLILLLYPFSTAEDEVKIITFNIRYGTADDGANSWPHRKEVLFDLVRDENADFLGLQEAMIFQIEEIIRQCPGYSYVGRTRQADGITGEATPILYRTDKYDLKDHGTLWLSENPGVPESKSWDTSLPRIFTWAVFSKKNEGKELVVYNTHYDHLGQTARHESSRVIISHMSKHFKDRNIILLGDFNALEESEPIRYLKENDLMILHDSYRGLHQEKNEKEMTFYGWADHEPGTGRRIDYIFHAGAVNPVEVYVSNYHEGERYPSDHMPVVATFRY
ncbi:MAG: endonuclease/exonuclease/phosphatase family protein [Cyclobacteriaceae bacterium]|nr:endonuclease/exonuclease/phosphatase family protein [Cyclobacteriaceae bacterium]